MNEKDTGLLKIFHPILYFRFRVIKCNTLSKRIIFLIDLTVGN